MTVSLSLVQGDQAWLPHVYVDNIALAAFESPTLYQCDPVSLLAYPPQTTLAITGENFIATPSISLNEIALTDVHMVNATTLTATLPATLTVGVYDVLVSNPNGQSNVLEAALIVRGKFFMPIVAKR